MKNVNRLVWIALVVAWVADQLFWQKTPGLSILLIVGVAVASGLYLAQVENLLPARASWVLLGPIFLLFGMAVIRREPVTMLSNVSLGVVLLMVFADTFRQGGWWRYGFLQYLALFFRLILPVAFETPFSIIKMRRQNQAVPAEDKEKRRSPLGPVLRGVLIALPVVWVFASLLSSADLVFAARLEGFFDLFNFEKIGEYILRAGIILGLAYGLSGVYLIALTRVIEPKASETSQGGIRFLGFTEGAIVLGSVNVLFLAFVAIQFQYFFGGEANIVAEGFTYANYARRGFGELVAVAVFSLLLFFVLSGITKREDSQKRMFSGLGVLMVLLIAVILASAFQRLLLYEEAYGFTRLRTYAHVFMIWLGILLAAFVALEITGRERFFALATLTVSFGFVLTLNGINVDGLIATQNLARADLPAQFDTQYLLSLSSDAVPAMFKKYDDPATPDWLKSELGYVLACRSAQVWAESAEVSWPSYHFSRARAAILFLEHADVMEIYPVYRGENGSVQVEVNHEIIPCQTYRWID